MIEDPLQRRLSAATRGRYEIVRKLGVGGMATVYLARDLALARNVAIKVLLPALASDEETVERFRREAKVSAALDHPNIVSVLDVGDDPALAYFVMQHIDGVTLANVIETEGAQPLPRVVSTITAVGKALQHAHSRGVVHRDVKPANLMLEPSGRVFVTDFGIAKREEILGLTASGAVFGTPQYMSPEQYNGLGATASSDQYALGVVMFELLAGRLPFVGGSVAEIMAQHLSDSPPRLLSLRPELPAWIDEVVQRTLSKDSAARFPSIQAMLQSLALGGNPSGSPIRGSRPGFSTSALATARATPRATTASPPKTPGAGLTANEATTVMLPPVPGRVRKWVSFGLLVAIAIALAAWILN